MARPPAPASFITLDFELANPSFASICSIGATRVVDGRQVSQRHWFVRPPAPYNYLTRFNEQLTGICVTDLVDALGFDYHGPNLIANLDGGILAGHGIRSADLPMMQQSWFAHPQLGDLPGIRYIDTVQVARDVLNVTSGLKLNQLYEEMFGEVLDGHHRADADAAATARILLELLRRSDTTVDDWAVWRPEQAWRPPKPPSPRPGGQLIYPPRVA